MGDKAMEELLEKVAREIVNGDVRAPSAILTVLKRRLLPLLLAGQASEDLVESIFSHVSHGGPTRADAEKQIMAYRAALQAAKGSGS